MRTARAGIMLPPARRRAAQQALGTGNGPLRLRADLILARQRQENLGRDVELLLQLRQALAAFFERALVVALPQEPLFRIDAALPQRRIDVATEQRRDVHLHLLAVDVLDADLVAVDRPHFVFREEDRA